jgi:hypothetical protein
MTRPLALLSVVLATALLAACGGDDDKAPSRADFNRDFNALNERLLTLGDEIGTSFRNVRGKSNEQIETEFGGFSRRLDEIEREFDELEPPDDVKPEYDNMKQGLATVSADMRRLVDAVRARQSNEIRDATRQFVQDSPKLRDARRALARKTGGRVRSDQE